MLELMWKNFFKNKNESQISFLKKQVLFSSLKEKEIRILEKSIHQRSYFSGEKIFKPGANTGFYMILKGQVEISYDMPDGDQVVVSLLKEGDFFGELALVQDKGFQKTTAQAASTTELLGLFRPELMSLIDKYPKIGSYILIKLSSVLGERLKKTGEVLYKKSQGVF